MNDRSTQIIPDSDAVVSCLAPEIVEMLDSHGTFTISELLETIKVSGVDRTLFRHELMSMIATEQANRTHSEILLNKLITFIEGDKLDENRYESYETIRKALLAGMNCTLLQTDEKSWQKGKIKVCFEFTPEENDPVATQETPVETHHSPLDEIRNSLVESN